jgi:hypothetical protein
MARYASALAGCRRAALQVCLDQAVMPSADKEMLVTAYTLSPAAAKEQWCL